MIARRGWHALHRLACFRNPPLAQKNGWHRIRGPLRTGIETDKILGPFGFAHLHERPGARTKSIVTRVERQRSVAFIRRLLQHPGITIDVAHHKMGLRTVWTTLD